MQRGDGRWQRAPGFAWVVVLMALALVAAAGAIVTQRWSDRLARDKEQQLLRIGDAYAQALSAYWSASPGSQKHYPEALQQLVWDTRFVTTRRHLRQIYADPVTGQADWVLLRDARGGIVGVRSRSERPTWVKVAQRLKATDLPAAERHDGWVFTPRVPS